jgi:hypothetical protein
MAHAGETATAIMATFDDLMLNMPGLPFQMGEFIVEQIHEEPDLEIPMMDHAQLSRELQLLFQPYNLGIVVIMELAMGLLEHLHLVCACVPDDYNMRLLHSLDDAACPHSRIYLNQFFDAIYRLSVRRNIEEDEEYDPRDPAYEEQLEADFEAFLDEEDLREIAERNAQEDLTIVGA